MDISDQNAGLNNSNITVPGTPLQGSSKESLEELQKICYGYIYLALATFGICGNAVTLIVLNSKRMNTNSTTIYLKALAVSDIALIVLFMFRFHSYKHFVTDEAETWYVFLAVQPIIDLLQPLHTIALGGTSLVTIALVVERFLVVWFPFHMKKKCTAALTRITILVIYVTVVGMVIPEFFMYKLHDWSHSGILPHLNETYGLIIDRPYYKGFTDFGKSSTGNDYHCYLNNYIVSICWFAIPWVMLCLFDSLLLYRVYKSSHLVSSTSARKSNRRLTLLLVLMVLLYLVFNFPACVLRLYRLATHPGDVCDEPVFEKVSTFDYANVVANMLSLSNSCGNFILYCSMGTRFRTEFKRIFGFGKCTSKVSDVEKPRVSAVSGPNANGIQTITARTCSSGC